MSAPDAPLYQLIMLDDVVAAGSCTRFTSSACCHGPIAGLGPPTRSSAMKGSSERGREEARRENRVCHIEPWAQQSLRVPICTAHT